MFVNSKKIAKLINKIAPENSAEDWDNVGFQIGNINLEIDRVLVALEVTKEVIDEAISRNINLIVTHHPLIFSEIKTLSVDDPISEMVIELIKNDINLYVAHTNIDVSENGLNKYLSSKFKLVRTSGLMKTKTLNEKDYYLGITGYFNNTMKIEDCINMVKKELNIEKLRVIRANNKPIKKIAICTGAGSDLIKEAKQSGAQCFITGDIKYHEAQFAIQTGISIIDAGHFETEIIFIDMMYDYLEGKCRDKGYDVKILKSESMIKPIEYV